MHRRLGPAFTPALPAPAAQQPPQPAGTPPTSPTAAAARLPLVIPLLERVTTIFKSVRAPADVAEALIRLWPWIEMALGEGLGGDGGVWVGGSVMVLVYFGEVR